jgi:hypothetical protein
MLRLISWASIAVLIGLAFKGPGADAVRWGGGFLQLFGLVTVAIEIAELRSKFEMPRITQLLVRWRRMVASVFSPRKHLLAAASGHIRVGSSASAHLGVTLPPGAPLHRRISVLEQQMQHLEELNGANHKKVLSEIERTRTEYAGKFRDLDETLQVTTERLKDVAVGGSTQQLVGWLWLLLGVAAATFPGEIAELVGLPT